MAYTDVPLTNLYGGLRTEYATVLPPGGRVHYVHHTGGRTTDPPEIQTRTYTNLNDALGNTTAGNGDTVYILPGHAENVSRINQMSNLKSGTRIQGLGWGALRGTFTFSSATATWLINVPNVEISNLIFNAAGDRSLSTALTVAVCFPITSTGFRFLGNELNVSIDSDQLCTNVFTMAAASNDCAFVGNYMFGAAAGGSTTVLTTTGASSRLTIANNRIATGIVTAATGILFDLSNAALVDNDIMGNHLSNLTTASRYCIKPHASSTGLVDGNTYYVLSNAALAPEDSGWTTWTTTYQFGRNWCVTIAAVGAATETAPIQDT